jgi:1,4-alpha-glucan branching enzyme
MAEERKKGARKRPPATKTLDETANTEAGEPRAEASAAPPARGGGARKQGAKTPSRSPRKKKSAAPAPPPDAEIAIPATLDAPPSLEETATPPHGDKLAPELHSASLGAEGLGSRVAGRVPPAKVQPTFSSSSAIAEAPSAPPKQTTRGGGEEHSRSQTPEPRPQVTDQRPASRSATRDARPSPVEIGTLPPPVDPIALSRLLGGTHTNPHSVLGAHPTTVGGRRGVVVRARQPDAVMAEVVFKDGVSMPLAREADSLFSAFVPDVTLPAAYRLRFRFPDGAEWERDDPYRFLPTLGDVDLHLFNEGTHRKLWEKLGAHARVIDGVSGVSFAVWAPNARRVSVVGEFNGWDGRIYPMRSLGASGVFEIFIPEIKPGALYKYELVTPEGMLRLKSDPFAFKMEQYPGTASIVEAEPVYPWNDTEWLERRRGADLARAPISIYEVHLGSWARVPEEGNRPLTYREIAPRLAEHVQRLGFTHVELMPVAEHPFYGSWGYQVSGYFAPTSRYGTPDDFRFFVDTLHQHGIGVLLDWVPAHFPKDDYALRRFDGTALYEHDDPRQGEHPDWGTLIFNYGRNEVRNFLVSNALYWLDEFHVDGLRVDAVASMLYLDYSREAGEWTRNRYGGRENLEAIDFLKQFNETIRLEAPGCMTMAEESTAWPGVTKPVSDGGLGFTFKWNMGWMHDTLSYFAKDPIYRRFHHDQITFAMLYEYSERFIMPLSHDEVVHLKGSLLNKLPGDDWQKIANLRLLLAYMFARPGKKLVFMGTELAPWSEWSHDTSLDWHLLRDDPQRAAFQAFVAQLTSVYREHSPFWREDFSWEGFQWIDVSDRDNSVISFVRRDGDKHAVVILNLTPLPREDYRIGVPGDRRYVKLLSSDDAEWGGSGHASIRHVDPEPSPFHGFPQSVSITLPPLGALLLVPEGQA